MNLGFEIPSYQQARRSRFERRSAVRVKPTMSLVVSRPAIRECIGSVAVRVSSRIAGETALLAGDLASVALVAPAALNLRRSGTHFALSMHVDDDRAVLMHERSRELCSAYKTWDEVRLMLDTYAETIRDKTTTISEFDRALLFETVRLSDSVVLRSWAEHGRLVDAVGAVRRDVDIVINEDPSIPAIVAAHKTDIVVYAPLQRADELAPFVTALGDLEMPITIVARDRPTIDGQVNFEPPERAAFALGRARVIIDAGSNDPGVALALARLGRPLVVSSVSGAAEILRGVRCYDVWDRRSILAAAVHSLSALPPQIRVGRFDDRPSPRAQPVFDTNHHALVSVIVATYNRRDLLATTLTAIERQTYPALEIIVVNDGGCDVSAIVAQFPRARLVQLDVNRGPAAARNAGLTKARGAFATFFDDDDEMFPDHIAALVNALESSGLDVAYGQLINCCADPEAGTPVPSAAIVGHTAVLDHADVQWAGALAPTAVMFRRTLADSIGGLDESLCSAEDYEFWLRLAEGREWARVSDVTSIYFIRNNGSNYSAKNNGTRRYFDAHQAIYAKHPSRRPLVQAGRNSMLAYFRE